MLNGSGGASTGVRATTSTGSPLGHRRGKPCLDACQCVEGDPAARLCCWVQEEYFPRRGSSDCGSSALGDRQLVNSSRQVALDREPHLHPS